MTQTKPQPEPKRNPEPNETRNEAPPAWDRLTAQSRYAYAQHLTARITALRDATRHANTQLAQATRALHATRTRADTEFRRLLRIRKEIADAEKKHDHLKKQITRQQNALANGPLAEAANEAFPKRNPRHATK